MKKENKKFNKIDIIVIIIIIAIIIIDQISKIVAQNIYQILKSDSNSPVMYIITNIIVIVLITRFMLLQNQFMSKRLKIFLSFIIAGGISNLIDRIIKGYVLEWISINNVEWLPMFNIADIFVLIGWVLVVGNFTYFTAQELKKKKISNK